MSWHFTSTLSLACVLVAACNSAPGVEEGPDSTDTTSTTTESETDATTDSMTETETDTGAETSDEAEPLPELVAYRLFLADSRDIYLVTPDGAVSQPLTFDEHANSLAWSPDGLEIAAALETGVGSDIFRITVEDGELTQLTDDNTDGYQLQWSPDGAAIAFVSSAGTNFRDVMAVSQDGTATWQVSDIPDAELNGYDWAPDAERIVVAASLGSGPELFVFEADGSGGEQITVNGQFDEVHDPEWSPDGEWIAFSGRDDILPMIQLIRPDGSELIPGSAVFASQPSWSPDGQSLAFRGEDQGSFRIGVLDLGGDPWYVDDGLADCWSPEWSADGSRVLFYCQPELDVFSIYVVDVGSGIVTPLADDGQRNDLPAWRPTSAP